MINQGFEEANQLLESVIKGKPFNRGGDFSVEVSCVYIFEGDDLYCERLYRKDRREI